MAPLPIPLELLRRDAPTKAKPGTSKDEDIAMGVIFGLLGLSIVIFCILYFCILYCCCPEARERATIASSRQPPQQQQRSAVQMELTIRTTREVSQPATVASHLVQNPVQSARSEACSFDSCPPPYEPPVYQPPMIEPPAAARIHPQQTGFTTYESQ